MTDNDTKTTDSMTRAEYLAQDEEDWKTIRALIQARCCLPPNLEKKYRAYREDQRRFYFARLPS